MMMATRKDEKRVRGSLRMYHLALNWTSEPLARSVQRRQSRRRTHEGPAEGGAAAASRAEQSGRRAMKDGRPKGARGQLSQAKKRGEARRATPTRLNARAVGWRPVVAVASKPMVDGDGDELGDRGCGWKRRERRTRGIHNKTRRAARRYHAPPMPSSLGRASHRCFTVQGPVMVHHDELLDKRKAPA